MKIGSVNISLDNRKGLDALKKNFCSKPKLMPFVKWAGGKRKLLPIMVNILPEKFETYYEPFLGGGALLLHLQPEKFVVSDLNKDLINLYLVVRDNVDGLISELFEYKNEKDFYYAMRDLDRSLTFSELPSLKKAARLLYLNKTCFNGLHRLNSKGHFNVPFGDNNRKLFKEDQLRGVSDFLKNNYKGVLVDADFELPMWAAEKDDFVYLDPPYDYVESAGGFTKYTKNGFNREDQIRLKLACDKLDSKGCKFLLSNSATGFIKDLYKSYHISSIEAPRCIDNRIYRERKTEELLIRNYEVKLPMID